MNILICDDLQLDAAQLNNLLQASGFQVHIHSFLSANDALNFIRNGAVVDCCFLDIVMPEMDGISLASALRKEGYTGKIVFLSSSKDYGPETYTVDAFSYLLKPPSIENISTLLKRLEQNKDSDDQASITVQSGKTTKILLYRNISYIEVMLHKVYFRMTDGSEVCMNATFSQVATQLLSDSRFIQCHRSYVVNMQDIAEISEREIITHNGNQIPIPRSYKNTRSKFYQWKFGGEK
ncbi:DNA-binding LytR/AlgR family response regulator [Aequitasia blattaphilus]|uniref:Stage 0 sporulation protein A homolog n=1 Tax=Aequitasia blattaphilus TaxID=2949332 RepID=A0ABT1ED38_9FIRM|nr:LytTR family DNA-binding domain-containing protein [Aequitasia blattaphilus]MCP1103698.1 LytTR family DNA-binding domain-containing protein [Aequitasia blattaphilus]MCR8616338.1 LytTR family DNA-binding domain-containing protein [Aequitasia blattaphilus]